MITEGTVARAAVDVAEAQQGSGAPEQVAAFQRLASPPADDLSRAFAAAEARRRIAALWEYAAPVAGSTYAAPHTPTEVARLVRDLLAAADRLSERDLATPDAEVLAALADLGASGAMARLYTYARRAHHLSAVAQLERELLANAMRDAGQR